MNLWGKLADRLVKVALTSPRRVLAVAVVVVLAGIVAGSRIRFDTDVLNLLPQDDPLVDRFRQVLDEFGATETLLVVERIGHQEDLDPALALADALEVELRKSPYISRVEARLENPLQLADAVLAHALLFLDEVGRSQLMARLSPEGLRLRAKEIRSQLEAPQAIVTKELVTRDLLGVLPQLLAHLRPTSGNLAIDASSGYYLASDHSLLVILAFPRQPAQDIGFDQKLFADLKLRIQAAKGKVAQEWDLREDDLPQVDLGGGHRIALEDATLIRRDTATNSLTSLVGVGLLLFFAFGRITAFALTGLPLLVGLASTFVFAGLAMPQLSQAAAGFAALLIGLGIDFSIVLYARFIEERNLGRLLPEAWRQAARETGPAIFLGAATTLATFYAFLFTHFVGLQHLGLLTGTGIVFLAAAALLLLPALSALTEGEKAHAPRLWLNLTPHFRSISRHRTVVMTVSLLVVVASLLLVPRLTFDDDVRHLRSPANRGFLVQEEVAQAFGQTFNAMGVRLEAADELTLLRKTQAFVEKVRPLQEAGVVARVDSIATLVPPLPHQERALGWLREQNVNPQLVVTHLRQALEEEGLVVEAFQDGLKLVERMLSPKAPVSYQMWQGTPLEQLIQRFLHHGDGYVSTLVQIYPPPGQWRRQAPPELVRLVQETPEASLVGVNVLAQHLRQVVRRDALVASAWGLLAVLALLFLQLRRWQDAMLCILPVFVGMVVAAGTAALLGLSLNPLNVFVATMVIGIGSDYGIHLVHRLREDPQGLAETGRAVALAAVTTIVGFGSLITSHFPGMASIGWLTTLGVFCSCLAALLLLPLLWRSR
ncbi:MAG: MMPL family transporter [Thermoanaerobaculaceae bacterium]